VISKTHRRRHRIRWLAALGAAMAVAAFAVGAGGPSGPVRSHALAALAAGSLHGSPFAAVAPLAVDAVAAGDRPVPPCTATDAKDVRAGRPIGGRRPE
jgi:hypothetical protein